MQGSLHSIHFHSLYQVLPDVFPGQSKKTMSHKYIVGPPWVLLLVAYAWNAPPWGSHLIYSLSTRWNSGNSWETHFNWHCYFGLDLKVETIGEGRNLRSPSPWHSYITAAVAPVNPSMWKQMTGLYQHTPHTAVRWDAEVVGFALCHVVNMMKSFHSRGYSECCVATGLEAQHGIDLYTVELKGFSQFNDGPVEGHLCQMLRDFQWGCWVSHSTLWCRLPAGCNSWNVRRLECGTFRNSSLKWRS